MAASSSRRPRSVNRPCVHARTLADDARSADPPPARRAGRSRCAGRGRRGRASSTRGRPPGRPARASARRPPGRPADPRRPRRPPRSSPLGARPLPARRARSRWRAARLDQRAGRRPVGAVPGYLSAARQPGGGSVAVVALGALAVGDPCRPRAPASRRGRSSPSTGSPTSRCCAPSSRTALRRLWTTSTSCRSHPRCSRPRPRCAASSRCVCNMPPSGRGHDAAGPVRVRDVRPAQIPVALALGLDVVSL